MKSALKAIGRSPAIGRMAAWFIRTYIRFVHATSNWSYLGLENVEQVEADEKGYVLAFWHSRLLMTAINRDRTQRNVVMLVSASRDGEIIADAIEPFGIRFIRGSAANPKKKQQAKGGGPALLQMIGALRAGDVIGITPDGPKGPPQFSKLGVIQLAQKTKSWILPASYATSRSIRLKTWDGFFLALPFSKGAFVAGEPIRVAGDATPQQLEEARALLDARLDEATAKAALAVGRDPEMAAKPSFVFTQENKK